MWSVLPAECLTRQFPVSKAPERKPKSVTLVPGVSLVCRDPSPGDGEKLLLAPPPNIVENEKLEVFWEEFLQA